MKARVIGGAALGAVALYLVGFVWWGLPFGPAAQVVKTAPDEAAFQAALREHLPATGVYFVPAHQGDDTETALETYEERHRAGPLAFVVFQREGKEPFSPTLMVLGFLHGFLACLLAAALLAALAAGGSLRARWLTVFSLGLFVAVFVNLGGLVWWSVPPAWMAVEAGYNLVGWALAGLPIAALVRRKPA